MDDCKRPENYPQGFLVFLLNTMSYTYIHIGLWEIFKNNPVVVGKRRGHKSSQIDYGLVFTVDR